MFALFLCVVLLTVDGALKWMSKCEYNTEFLLLHLSYGPDSFLYTATYC